MAWILAEQHIVVGIHVGQVISALQHTLLKLGNEAGCFNVNGAIWMGLNVVGKGASVELNVIGSLVRHYPKTHNIFSPDGPHNGTLRKEFDQARIQESADNQVQPKCQNYNIYTHITK